MDSPFLKCVSKIDYKIEIEQLFHYIEQSKKDSDFTEEEIPYIIDYHNQKGDDNHTSILFGTIHSMDLKTFANNWKQFNEKIDVTCFQPAALHSVNNDQPNTLGIQIFYNCTTLQSLNSLIW